MAGQQQDYYPIIQKFRRWVDENSLPGTLGETERVNCKFMSEQRLETWFKEGTHTPDLLQALWGEAICPVQPTEIYGKCSRAFAILILIGMGKFIQYFIQHDSLWDKQFDANSCPKAFPTSGAHPDFFKKYVESQWQFFPHTFDVSINNHLNPERILPIKTKELIGSGGYADLYKITLHAGYDNLTPYLDQSRDANTGFSNTYVLKTYRTPDAESHYRQEVNAFQHLMGRKDCLGKVVIGFYGSFIQGDTYNVLLEYANGGTLEDFLHKTDPPTNAQDIYKLWSAIFNLLKAVVMIHGLSPATSDGLPILRGWHQDIKPTNILVTNSKSENPFDAQFKLADLGLAHFRRIKGHASTDAAQDLRGTRIYGAPECYRFDEFDETQPVEVKQSVDCWSLGCIFSEVAVWLVLGKGALLRYRKDRQVATAKLSDFCDQGSFHDGNEVLPSIKDAHDRVLEDIRESDHITRAVVKRMIGDMMVHVEGRSTARQLRFKAQEILKEAMQAEKNRLTQLGQDEGFRPISRQHERLSLSKKKRLKMPSQLPPGFGPDPMRHDYAGRNPEESEPKPLRKKSYTTQFSNQRSTPASSARTSLDASYADSASITHLSGDEMVSSSSRPGVSPRPIPDGNRLYVDMATLTDQMSSSAPTPPTHRMTRDSAFGLLNNNFGEASIAMAPVNSPSKNRTSHEKSLLRTDDAQGVNAETATPITDEQEPILSREAPPEESHGGRTALNERKPIPTLRLQDLEIWMLKKKQSKSPWMILENKKEVMKELGDRDHVFLIDNAISMRNHWKTTEGVINLAKAMAYIVKESDRDGMEVYFTNSKGDHKVSTATQMEQKLLAESCHGTTNMASSLGKILQKYDERLRDERNGKTKRWALDFWKPKKLIPLNVYIFTDAEWQPNCNVADKIRSLVATMQNLGFHREQVGLQFIQFGDNPICTKKLEDLDNAKTLGVPVKYDIVDTEPAAGGNCWKMLVGAINKWYDESNESERT